MFCSSNSRPGTRRLLRRSIPTLLGLALLLLGASATAQPAQSSGWDPDRWLELVRHSDELYEQALAVPESDLQGYRSILREALLAKQEALEMLRRAVLLNQIQNVERLWEDANRDLFNLSENVIVLLLELDQCDAALLNLERALGDRGILPQGGPEHLETLRPEVDACRDRVASETGPAFDRNRFDTYVQLGERWRETGEQETDTEARNAALYESSQNYGQAVEMLRAAILAGRVSGAQEEETLFGLYDNLIGILFQMDLCAGAQRRIRQAVEDAAALSTGDPAHFEARNGEIAACQERRLQNAQPEVITVTAAEEDPDDTLAKESDSGYAPYVLWGVAGAAAITAVTLDLITGSDRDELDSARDSCESGGPCDYARNIELAEDINDMKVTIGVLAGVSIVTAAVGTILFFTSEDADSSAPVAPREQVGVPRFSIDGLGGSMSISF